jgi:myo-inositol-1(or 4)-monophosphatase
MRNGIEETAIEAVHAGGAVLRERFAAATTSVAADFQSTDVKADADVATEEAMLPVVREAYPDHEIYAEESGTHPGEADYRWAVDPLDGTNNFAAGLPSFGSAVAVLRSGDPVVAAVHVPTTGETYLASRDRGVFYDGGRHEVREADRDGSGDGAAVTFDGERVTAESHRSLEASTVVSVIGHDVATDEALLARAEQLHRAIEGAAKRRLPSWSPTVHWGLLARGRLDAVIAFHPDEEEQHLGELFVAESGMASERGDAPFLAAANRELLAALRDSLPLS